MQKLPTVTLISSFFALAAGVFALDTREPVVVDAAPIYVPSNQGDACITRVFREALVSDDSLTITARTIKAYTVDGVMKLRGDVIYPEERARIVAMARAQKGVVAVDDQLSILAP